MSARQKPEIRKPKRRRVEPVRPHKTDDVLVCHGVSAMAFMLEMPFKLQDTSEDLGRLKMCFGSTTSKVRGRVADWQVNARVMLGLWLDRPRTVREVACVFCRILNHTFRGTHSIWWLPFLEQVSQWACIFLRCCEYVCAVSLVFSVVLFSITWLRWTSVSLLCFVSDSWAGWACPCVFCMPGWRGISLRCMCIVFCFLHRKSA